MYFNDQTFALDAATVKYTQTLFDLPGRLLTYAMHHHREKIKLTYYTETKKRAHDSQIVRADKNLKLRDGGPSLRHESGIVVQ